MPTIYVSDKDILPERHPQDLYITPQPVVEHACKTYLSKRKHVSDILDIGAYDGRWGITASMYMDYDESTSGYGNVTLVEKSPMLDPDIGYQVQSIIPYYNTDFLTWESDRKYQVIVSNPPYRYAGEIIKKAISLLDTNGIMIFLLRLDFVGSVTRYEDLWVNYPLLSLGVYSRRINFYGTGTNGDTYAVFHWQKMNNKLIGSPREWYTYLMDYKE